MQFAQQIALVLLTASLSVAQTAQDLSGLPACASAGALQAITASGCESSDVVCICKSQSFTSSLEAYAKQNCSAADYATAITVGQNLCAQNGVVLSSSSAVIVDAVTTSAAPSSTMTMSNGTTATVTVDDCGCEDDMPTASSTIPAAPIATFTGAANRAPIEVKMAGAIVGAVGLLAVL